MALCAALGATTAAVDGSLPYSGRVSHAEKRRRVPSEAAQPPAAPATPPPTVARQLAADRRTAKLALDRANTAYAYVQHRAAFIEQQLSNVQRLEQQVRQLQAEVAALQAQRPTPPRKRRP